MDDLFGNILAAIVWFLIQLPGAWIAQTLRPNAEPSGFRTGLYGVLFWVVLIGIIGGLQWLAAH